jgi:predicted NBD/HSP70 family sugar kinase
MKELSSLARPQVVPPLDDQFAPAALAVREFLNAAKESGRTAELVIALERGGGQVSVYKTWCFEEGTGNDALNFQYAERLVKFLLWRSGGWKIIVGGPKSIGEFIRQAYSPGGIRAWDAEFMAGVYEQPFTVEVTEPDKVPQANEGTVRLGGHLDGCRIGFDLGATDRKVAAVVDGQTVYTEEVVWNPRDASDPDYHYNEINSALKAAAAHMPRVDAIGGSAAGIYINNRPRVASLFRGVPKELFEARIANLFLDLQKEWGGIPFEVVNDGEVTALAGSMTLGEGAVLGIAMGSSEAGGYVTPQGEITTWLNELAFCPVDYNPNAPIDEWSGEFGCGVQYFSQQAVFRLAQNADIATDPSLGPADKLKWLQTLLRTGNAKARKVWETIGVYTGYGIAHYANFYELRHVLILGRVTSGEGGGIIIEQAQEVLKREFPELAERVKLHLPDESSRRVGQAVAAASLPIISKHG